MREAAGPSREGVQEAFDEREIWRLNPFFLCYFFFFNVSIVSFGIFLYRFCCFFEWLMKLIMGSLSTLDVLSRMHRWEV